MRKKGCYHKNRPFRLLVAAALRFVQSYLNDIAPDTGVSGLQLVAVEYLPSIEGAVWICQAAPFCGEGFLYLLAPNAFPYEGKVARR